MVNKLPVGVLEATCSSVYHWTPKLFIGEWEYYPTYSNNQVS